MTVVLTVGMACRLEFGHKGKCECPLKGDPRFCEDVQVTWRPTQEERIRILGKIVEESGS
jgi:hypothetical protein